MTAERFIQVAIPSPLRRTFDYKSPASLKGSQLKPGTRVQVPFGNRRVTGIVVGSTSDSDFPADKIRLIGKILDAEPVLPAELMQLYVWAADYYQYPVGQALQTSLPANIRKGLPAEEKLPRVWRLTAQGRALDPDSLNRAPRQQQMIALLQRGDLLATADISKRLDFSASACLRTLAGKGLLAESDAPAEIPKTDAGAADLPLALNDQQQAALEKIQKGSGSYNTFLLDGVTGSGKTEIYLQGIAEILAQGKQALVLVPEISLTPQTIRRFEQRFDRAIVAFHSGLTDTQRLAAWLRARSGAADIIIGTRSAIFTPLARPGLIIVDEEHDASYKQQDGFRYSGRDLAIYRARQLDIPVILGSATPSLESLNNALSGRYDYLQLTERAGEASHPDFRLLDLKGQEVTEGFSLPLLDSIRAHLASGNQVLVFLNRRGFSPLLLCRDCGWIATCPRCESSYTLHRNPPCLHCHHCESRKPVPETCSECNSTDLLAMGLGTEKTEKTLEALLPDIPVYRIDRDSTRQRNALHDMIEKVDSGQPCILVGTQMLSKGHHFPNVTLVAVLDADGGLFSADFRGQEHMGQLLTQVAGRAGRGENRGEVLIQTYNSTHPTLLALIREGYGPFARTLLEERRLGNLPPFTYMALIRAEAANRDLPEKLLHHAREAVASGRSQVSVMGPMPSPMEKRGGFFRLQLIIESDKRSRIQQCLAALLPVLEGLPESRKVRWSVDIDPIDFT